MSFSKEWDDRYKENTQMSIWPWSDLVSYVMRYARPEGHDFKILELGCGPGANIPFFKHLGVEYYAIEGSKTIVNSVRKKFPEYKDFISIGDFTEEIPFDKNFDLIIDRASITHNTTSAIKRTLKIIYNKLNPGGKFIGIDWFSTMHSDYQKGVIDEDINTRNLIEDGQFLNLGRVHFSDEAHLLELFKEFEIILLEHKTLDRKIPVDKHIFASWNFVVLKH